jgi:hypothetical protein
MNASCGTGRACALILFALAASCGSKDQDPHWRVGAYRPGQLESDLRREVGPPTHERPVDVAEEHGPCRGTDAERELTYDIPSRGVAKCVREMFGMSPYFRYVVCVNRTGQIVGVSTVEVD